MAFRWQTDGGLHSDVHWVASLKGQYKVKSAIIMDGWGGGGVENTQDHNGSRVGNENGKIKVLCKKSLDSPGCAYSYHGFIARLESQYKE